MKKFLLTTVAFGVLALPAMAADMALGDWGQSGRVGPKWTGFYVGVNGGYGWANSTVTETPFQNFAAPLVSVRWCRPPLSVRSSMAPSSVSTAATIGSSGPGLWASRVISTGPA